jgi:hypothetical protein
MAGKILSRHLLLEPLDRPRNPVSTCGKAQEVNILFACKTSEKA